MRLLLTALLALALACGDDDGDETELDAGADMGEVTPPDMGPVVIERTATREPCADRDPLRNPYFGDLHVHTRFSFDAAAYGVRTGPDDAYRFAKGEAIGLPPYDADGNPTRMVQLDRPLDFASVTDHAELIAATSICTDPTNPGYDSRTCVSYRDADGSAADFGEFISAIGLSSPVPPRLCRSDPDLCAAELADVWALTVDAAETHDDRSSACEFSTLIGYEWTGGAGGGRNLHRNVFFRTSTYLARPISFVDANSADRLWDGLEANCLESGTDCDLLAIPHNSNISSGDMFSPLTEDGDLYDAEFAARRAALEPLIEIYQHKGASECVSGIDDPLASEDELCAFESVFEVFCDENPDAERCVERCESGSGGGFINGCVSASDMARGALKVGLQERLRTGANPFQFGFIASTDTHNTIPGAVREEEWPGHTGDSDDEPEEALEPPIGVTVSVRTSSPGGLAVVWAEENSRPALFDAMRRRETYGTSGTRIIARFFGGWDYATDLCDEATAIETADGSGVPMGGELGAPPSAGAAPTFLVSALADAMSVPLQRIQLIKGWIDPATGEPDEQVYEVAGDPDNGADVDTATCEPTVGSADAGFGSLCNTWTDPDFDPSQPAFYYVRILENPTCRWSQRLCVELAVDCDTIDPTTNVAAACCEDAVPAKIQERAWTSPIWYVPE